MHAKPMTFFNILLTLLLLVFGEMTFGAPVCSRVFTSEESKQVQYYRHLFEKAQAQNPRMHTVLNSFLDDAVEFKLRLPKNLVGDSEEQAQAEAQLAKKWMSKAVRFAHQKDDLKISTEKIQAAGRAASEVYIVTLDNGSKVVFRPGVEVLDESIPGRHDGRNYGGNITVIRKTMMANKLNRWFSLRSTADCWLGTLNGQTGLFSEFIPYEISENAWKFDFHRRPDARYRRLYDLEAFEFLIGNYEAGWALNTLSRTKNVLSNSGSMEPALQDLDIVVIDHDPAFIPGIHESSLSYRADTGTNLPALYSKTFVEKLKTLTEAELKLQLGSDATEIEIRGIMFRRALMLRDIDLRGSDVVIP